jgi:hypothetical protein
MYIKLNCILLFIKISKIVKNHTNLLRRKNQRGFRTQEVPDTKTTIQ